MSLVTRWLAAPLAACAAAAGLSAPAAAVSDPVGANHLITGVLSDVRLSSGKRSTITFQVERVARFRDRPVRTAEKLDFSTLRRKARWRRTFGAARPRVELAVAGSPDLVAARIGRPKRVGGDRFRSTVSFPSGPTLRRADVRGQDLVFFAHPRPVKAARVDCVSAAGRVPNNADFIGEVGRTTITGKRGDAFLRLESKRPRTFRWFLGDGAGCERRFIGPVDFRDLLNNATWRSLFGNLNPNSALVWGDENSKGGSLEFEQGRPRWDRDRRKWVSKIWPLNTKGSSARKKVKRFIAEHGPRTNIRSGYLFMDSTNSIYEGGEVFVVDQNFQITYSVREQDLLLEFAMNRVPAGWMGVGFSAFMFPGDNIVVWMDESNEPVVWDAYNPGIPTLPAFPSPYLDDSPILLIQDGSPFDNQENVEIAEASAQDGWTRITVTRDLVTNDIFDYQFVLGQDLRIVAAYNDSRGFFDEVGANQPMHTNYGSGTWTL